ncbi:hypothetical protein ACRALDRAFT_211031 [Sodiomyces alcalophilus JCM 7366]|uniref:uncharacterized protein n=1 Tax=Sodiomyces alcalophilus JCM 7366 TaxID=591952 RepID=UPI0039B46F09
MACQIDDSPTIPFHGSLEDTRRISHGRMAYFLHFVLIIVASLPIAPDDRGNAMKTSDQPFRRPCDSLSRDHSANSCPGQTAIPVGCASLAWICLSDALGLWSSQGNYVVLGRPNTWRVMVGKNMAGNEASHRLSKPSPRPALHTALHKVISNHCSLALPLLEFVEIGFLTNPGAQARDVTGGPAARIPGIWAPGWLVKHMYEVCTTYTITAGLPQTWGWRFRTASGRLALDTQWGVASEVKFGRTFNSFFGQRNEIQ